MNSYHPVSCDFYDHLEEIAVLGKTVEIKYMDENENKKKQAKVMDFIIQNKVEYMVLSDSSLIRLDLIKEIDGISPDRFINA